MTPGVGTRPEGDRQLTAMPSAYTSDASPDEKRSMAALHMPYTVEPGRAVKGGPDGWLAARDEMFRIQPHWRSRMPGSIRCASSNGARTCTSNMTWKWRSG